MAVVPNATTFSGVGTRASLSDRVFSGDRRVSKTDSGPTRVGKVSSSVQFFSKAYKSLRYQANSRSDQARTVIMSMGTPIVPYKTEDGQWQLIDLWNALYRERLIIIGEYVDVNFSNQTLATMLYLDSIESSKKLYIYVNGCGGDILSAFAMYDTMNNLKSPIATHCIGYAHDIGAFILAAGEKGDRTCTGLSRISFQPLVGSAQGQADDVLNETRELVRIRDKLFNELSARTGQPIEKINKDFARSIGFSPREAQEYGIIDRIIRPKRLEHPEVSD